MTPTGPPFKPASFIASHPVFRLEEFLEAHAASGATRQTSAAVLKYHVKNGTLFNLRRGLYAHTEPVDPWLLGSRLTRDAVIAYDGALSFHGLGPTEYSLSFLTLERTAAFAHDDVAYTPIRDPRSLAGRADRGGFIDTVERGGQPFRVTSKERTLVDMLDRLDLGQGTKTLWDAFVAATPFDPTTLVDYAKTLKSRIAAGRLGYFLERLGAQNHVLLPLMKYAPKSAAYFERCTRTRGDRYMSKWKLVVPRHLIAHIDSGQTVKWWEG